jgi:hypothetical protein
MKARVSACPRNSGLSFWIATMFTSDSRTENFLTSLGIKFEYRNGILLPKDFVKGWDKDNLGRPVPVREDAVFEYAALMEGGSPAPATILHETENGYAVLDGVQRLSAAELRQETRISAYVVITNADDSLAAIRVLANARMQGRAEPAEWTRRRAVDVLVVQRDMSVSEVAKMGGWKPGDVKRIADAIRMQNRILAVGGPELSDAILVELKPYIESGSLLESAKDPLINFMKGIKQARLSASDSIDYIASFFQPLPKNSNPYKTYVERVELFQADPEIHARITGRRTTELPKDIVLLRALKTAETVADQLIAHGEKIKNVDEFYRIMNNISRKLKAFNGKKVQP